MNATINELVAAPKREKYSRIHLPHGLSNASRGREGKRENGSHFNQTLPRLLDELVLSLPTLPEVQAFFVWLGQSRGSMRLHLLMVDPSARLQTGTEFRLGDSIADWTWQHHRPLIIKTEAETRFPEFARQLSDGGIKSFCAAPLIMANRRIGVIGLASANAEAFRDFKLESIQRSPADFGSPIPKDRERLNPPGACESQRNRIFSHSIAASKEDNFEGIIGRSKEMRNLRNEIKVLAPTKSTALILGETGTGKELIARAIHNLSARRENRFVKVNCAAIPSGLLESELFGHERGAFTGAVGRRIGRFEMAHHGTLFLDEVGDIPLELQPKLLRVLQEQEFERLGGTQTTCVDVRVVAATSRDLPRMVAARTFRGDLYYRLNVFPLRAPSLRERWDDIPLLALHFLDLYGGRMNKCITDISNVTMEALLRYSWPGNVRELQNIIERAVILSPGKMLMLPPGELMQGSLTTDQVAEGAPTTLKDAEREHIIQALAATNWVLGGPKGAGARLGLARTTLISKMQRLGISRTQA